MVIVTFITFDIEAHEECNFDYLQVMFTLDTIEGSRYTLKALDTFDNCQRPVFSLVVSKHDV